MGWPWRFRTSYFRRTRDSQSTTGSRTVQGREVERYVGWTGFHSNDYEKVIKNTRREQEKDCTGTQLHAAGRPPTSSIHSMNARKCVHAQKPFPSQAFAHESSKVGGREKREEERQERQRPGGWWKERQLHKTKTHLRK